MKIQYASDLHLEFDENKAFLIANEIKPMAEILILAGDVFIFKDNMEQESYFDFLSKNFKEIYWIPGNHEYYHTNINILNKYQNNKIRHNIHIVNNQVITINDVNFVFSTLWSSISQNNEQHIKHSLSDFSLISYNQDNFTPAHFNELYETSKQFLLNELEKLKGKKNIVITHHVPTFVNYPAKYLKSLINEAFAVEMKDVILNYQPEAWIYGHTHVNTPDFTIGKTKMLTNQLGYVYMKEHMDIRLDACIEI